MLVSELIEDVRRELFTGSREERNKLAASMDGTTTSALLTFDLGAIKHGAKLSIDLEDMYVWSTSSLTATVDRGQWGSTAAVHSNGALVHVNPKFSNFEIVDAIRKEVKSLSAPSNGLYNVEDYPLTYNPVISGYDFPYSVLSIYEVRYTTPGPSKDWVLSQDWELSRHAGSGFASDTALFIRDAYPNYSVVIKAKTEFAVIPFSLTADTTTLSIPDTVLDIISIGAAWRLTAPREVRRNFNEVQGDTRRAGEVPAGANLGGSRELGRLRSQRIAEEASRLSVKYPDHSRRYPFAVGGY